MNKILKLIDSEAFRYVVVGGCTTLVNLISFAILCDGLSVATTIANVISIALAILFAYATNKIFVFKSKCKDNLELFQEFSKFVSARLITMVIEVVGVYLLVDILMMNAMVGKLWTQVIVLVSNFFISKFIVFRG